MLLIKSGLFLAWIFLWTLPAALGYPFGAPSTVCLAPFPHHNNVPPQTGTTPFKITLDSTTYRPGQTIKMTISSDEAFAGYLLKLRRKNGDIQEALGSWANCTDENIQYMSVFAAVPNANNCLTHSNNNDRTGFSCLWTAPPTNEGNLVVSATIVYELEEYYVDTSTQLNSVEAVTQTDPTSALTTMPTISECGSSKGCILYPNQCYVSGSCSHMISYQFASNTTVNIEMLKPTSCGKYAAFGLSKDEKMGKDSMVFCNLQPDGSPMVQTANGVKDLAQFSLDKFVTNRKAGILRDFNGVAYMACSFTLPVVISLNYFDLMEMAMTSETLMLNESNSVFLADGSLISNTFAYLSHTVTPMVSSSSLMLATKDYAITYFYGISRNVKIHSTLMTIAWLLFAPLAHIIVTHFRANFTYKVCHKQMWFWVHVLSILTTMGLVIASFIFILVSNYEWKTEATAHGVLACVTTGLMLLNFVVGIFRPDETSPRRKWFNILHSLNGYITRMLSIVTIWLAITLPKLNPRFQTFAYVVIGIWTVFEFLSYVILFIVRYCKYKKFRKYEWNPNNSVKPVRDRFVHHCPTVGFLFYILCIMGLFSAFIIDIWLN